MVTLRNYLLPAAPGRGRCFRAGPAHGGTHPARAWPEALECWPMTTDAVLIVQLPRGGEAGEGDEPLVIEVEAAEYLREDELVPVLAATRRASRPVILRLMTNA